MNRLPVTGERDGVPRWRVVCLRARRPSGVLQIGDSLIDPGAFNHDRTIGQLPAFFQTLFLYTSHK